MINIPLMILFAMLPIIIHELGHELMAKKNGIKLKWEMKFPRLVWTYNSTNISATVQKEIKLAGFKFEFIGAGLIAAIILASKIVDPTCALVSIGVAVIHRIAYPMYAGKYNDLN